MHPDTHARQEVPAVRRKSSRPRGIAVLGILLLLAACSSGDRFENADSTVYITESGTRYHRESCIYVDESAEEVPLGYAVGQGLRRCPVCSPPELEEAEPDRLRSFLLFLGGGLLAACIILGIPTIVHAVSVRRQATQIAMSRAGPTWRELSRTERLQRIRLAKARLEEPPPDRTQCIDRDTP